MTDERPKYLQIVDDLRRKIASGELPPGARLPSRPEIMRDYGVSNTVALRVGEILKAEGLAEARAGAGTFVRGRPTRQKMTRAFTLRLEMPGSSGPDEMERRGHRIWSYDSRTTVAPSDIRERLALPEATGVEDVVRTAYVYSRDDEPVMLSTSWEPLALTRGTPIVMPEDGPHVGVADRMLSIGVVIDGCTELVEARTGEVEECAGLKIPPRSVVFAIERTCYAQGRPVQTADIVLSAERYVLEYGEPVRSR
ncbi:GntR family transcriptional regulator [Thermoactinospora rubra]|uniref:GntR family transcriptional regulator n=1 Tax=Thermoactinospora rubra TaxID=1088767 RepID=UPI00117DF785|nr:GntR family transcriptional regulator [Thermoactinospora rubra]